MSTVSNEANHAGDAPHAAGGHRGDRSMYLRFGAMIATSIVVMYLVTYLNVFSVSHIHFSEERIYMALTMGAAIVQMASGTRGPAADPARCGGAAVHERPLAERYPVFRTVPIQAGGSAGPLSGA
jgi:hypothetical protein